MLAPLMTMAVAQLFDFGTFVVMISYRGAGAEANPLVAAILEHLGLAGVALAKAALVLLVAAIAVILSTPSGGARGRLAGAVVAAAIAAGVFGGWTNAITIGFA